MTTTVQSQCTSIEKDLIKETSGCTEKLSMHLRLWLWTTAVVVCVLTGNLTNESDAHWIIAPVLWFVGGTALFGLYSVGNSAANETFSRNAFVNTVLGTLTMLPAMRCFASFHTKKAISSGSAWMRTVPVVGGFYDWIRTDFANARCRGFYVANLSLVCSAATSLFFFVLWFSGPLTLFKYYIAPWLIFQLWCSWSCQIELSLKVTMKKSKEMTKLRRVCKSLGSFAPYGKALYKEARACGWNKRVLLLKVYATVFGNDMLCSDRLPSATVVYRKFLDAPIVKKKRTKGDEKRGPYKWTTIVWLFGSPMIALYGILTTPIKAPTLGVAFVFYWLGGLGITGGYHRLFSHRTFKATWPMRLALLVMGTSAFEGSCLWWCSDHRTHHRYTDTPRDPYNAKNGFWYSHIGWLLTEPPESHRSKGLSRFSDIRDLEKDPVLRFQHRFYAPLALLTGLVAPTIVAGYFFLDWRGGFFIAAFAKAVALQHSTFFINSLAQYVLSLRLSLSLSPRSRSLMRYKTSTNFQQHVG